MLTYDVIKQNDSKVLNDMLLVSENLFQLSIMSMSMLKPGTCRKDIVVVTKFY